jgi:4-nitrophenyl phosphatase
MIGDNLDTDIKFGGNGGIDTLCVLTGVSNEEMVLKSNISTYYS